METKDKCCATCHKIVYVDTKVDGLRGVPICFEDIYDNHVSRIRDPETQYCDNYNHFEEEYDGGW